MMNKILLILLSFIPSLSIAASNSQNLDLTNHMAGYIALILFVFAYIFVMLEEFTHMRKSKPVILAAGAIWAIIGWVYAVKPGQPVICALREQGAAFFLGTIPTVQFWG